jgi:ABC-2 type transport system permease protein
MRGLWQLTWLETRIFIREPLGLIGTVLGPILIFVVLGRTLGDRVGANARIRDFVAHDLPILAVILIALNAVLSLITIIAIYREGGILKRLRATPLRPYTILTAHVLVKLGFSILTLALMAAAGRRIYPGAMEVPWFDFAAALALCTVSIMSIGFVVASLVPTARFAQPAGALLFYPMLGLSGLFMPLTALPAPAQALAHALPLTYAVSLLRGIWLGNPWSDHLVDVLALAVVFAVCIALSTRVFRWE